MVLAKQFEMDVGLMGQWHIHISPHTDLIILSCLLLEGKRCGDGWHNVEMIPHHIIHVH